MATPEQDTEKLIDKYLSGEATPEEVKRLERAYHQAAARLRSVDESAEEINRIGKETWMTLIDQIGHEPVRTVRLWPRIAAAASLLLFLSVGGYFLLHKQQPQQMAQNHVQDIAPGGNKAVLTLANGRKISLTDAENGNIAQQSGTQINKTKNGQVVYAATNNNNDKTGAIAYNTLATPRGGQYTLTLADGTIAYLNAASSIKYPVTFKGGERKVEITGEVYFEVVHNATKPFRVSVKNQVIEDIGTHFNINAYDDEPAAQTTLVEGSIRVTNGGRQVILKPGQQTLISTGSTSIMVREADTDQVTAWKDGDFIFHDADLPSIMRQLSRWYNIDVAYGPNLSGLRFGGMVSRNKNISAVLAIMENTGKIHFNVSGRRVMVITGRK